jgi:hypothetical protein
MIAGEVYFSNGAPRMTRKEAEDLTRLGFAIQIESAHGADTSEGRIFSPLYKKTFCTHAFEEGIVDAIPAYIHEERAVKRH